MIGIEEWVNLVMYFMLRLFKIIYDYDVLLKWSEELYL